MFLVALAFQSTLPMRGETKTTGLATDTIQISIHSPHAGRDLKGLPEESVQQVFQSTLPMRGETSGNIGWQLFFTISIHSPHAGRDC